MLTTARYRFLLVLIVLVYIAGMFVTLFENDSAQFAVMAMRMVQENDFWTLIKGTEEYLDKPHMHYWLAAISFKIFGIHEWAYRIPGILASLLAAYSCFGMGKLFYNRDVGRIASLIFLTAQTIVLSNIDVRTDAVLTGFAILALWQLAAYIEKGSTINIAVGAFAAAVAFSTKGQIALLVIGLPLICHLVYTRQWQRLFNWRMLVALGVFALTISPMLYAYYQQFDLHPEKVIRGKDNRSGIFFIFWEQSFERLSGEGVGKNSSDYLFFFHTFLWVFLPWTFIGLAAYWDRFRLLWKSKTSKLVHGEALLVGGIGLIFIIISFAQFKLPHYLNITIPLFAVLGAGYLDALDKNGKQKSLKWLLKGQCFILGVVILSCGLLCFYVFPDKQWYLYVLLFIALFVALYAIRKEPSKMLGIVMIGVYSAAFFNVVMNTHFYPHLLEYQGGSTMAEQIKEADIPVEKVYRLPGGHSWGLDFYNQLPTPMVPAEQLVSLKDVWVYVSDKEKEKLTEMGMVWTDEISVEQFRITRLQAKFLNPKTRDGVVRHMHLLYLP